MALTNTEILAGINAAFADAASWARAMQRLALTDDIAEVAGRIAQGEAEIAARDQAAAVWLAKQREALAMLQAQLDALAAVPDVPTKPGA